MKGFLLGIITTLLVLVGIAMFVAKTGRVNFSADQKPSDAETHMAMSAVDASTDRHAPEVKNPWRLTKRHW